MADLTRATVGIVDESTVQESAAPVQDIELTEDETKEQMRVHEEDIIRGLIEAADVEFGFSACGNGVDAGTALDYAEVEGALGSGRNFELINTDDSAGQAVNSRADDTELVEAVPAGAFENNAEALAADSAAQDAVNVGGVDGDHAVIVVLFFEERFAAA